jgi:hypothetical protein
MISDSQCGEYGMKLTVFWDGESCSLAKIVRHFRGAYYLQYQCALMMEAVSTSETPINLYEIFGSMSQKTVIFME